MTSKNTAKHQMPEFLLSIDPGKMTGIALIDCTGDEPVILWSTETEYDDTGDLINKTLYEYQGRRIRIVYERFIVTPMTAKNSVADWSLELIGVIKYLAHAYKLSEPLVPQMSSKAKKFCPNPRLKAVGFWHRGGAGHARDALRHAVTHLVDCGWAPAKLLPE